jgi:hypothetical protein
MLQLIVEEVSKLDYKPKSLAKDYERVKNMVNKMQSILTHEFLKVNFNSRIRDINKDDWSNLWACQKSESGSIGIYFLQCGDVNDKNNPEKNEIIVAKPYTLQDFERTLFVNELATNYFQIKSPKIRYIARQDKEFEELQNAVKHLFEPLFGDLYEIGGSKSPKDLFSSKGIMIVEFVNGKQLTHRKEGQRNLAYEDFYEIGKIFLFDLIIRNTDRFPCRKALPRPMNTTIHDEGNPGNIMIGHENGSVWSIDPELQINVDNVLHDSYGRALQSVVKEIVYRQDLDRRYKSIATLFFKPIHGIEDILPLSLNEIKDWELCNENEKLAIDSILQLIRIKLANDHSIIEEQKAAESNTIIIHPDLEHHLDQFLSPSINDDSNSTDSNNNIPASPSLDPPQSIQRPTATAEELAILEVPLENNEKAWREWVRHIIPRVMEDLFEFLEIQTGYNTPYFASEAFCQGFLHSLQSAVSFKREYQHPSSSFYQIHKEILENAAFLESSIDISFVLDMISRIERYWDEFNGNGSSPQHGIAASLSNVPLQRNDSHSFYRHDNSGKR